MTYEELTDAECLKERKWWCFLVSSICTFVAGILTVLIWRAVTFLCCRPKPRAEYSQSAKEPKPAALPAGQKPQFEGSFVSEAKDWAGELISGQTTTGRIMVSTAPQAQWPGALPLPGRSRLKNWYAQE